MVGGAAMIKVEDANRVSTVVDLVAHAILPAARTPMSLEGCAQRRPDPAWRRGERSRDELPPARRRRAVTSDHPTWSAGRGVPGGTIGGVVWVAQSGDQAPAEAVDALRKACGATPST